jgi:hypothetical protein
MIESHEEHSHKELMLMPLLFISYENYIRSSKSFQERFELDGGSENLPKTNQTWTVFVL